MAGTRPWPLLLWHSDRLTGVLAHCIPLNYQYTALRGGGLRGKDNIFNLENYTEQSLAGRGRWQEGSALRFPQGLQCIIVNVPRGIGVWVEYFRARAGKVLGRPFLSIPSRPISIL